MAAWPEPKTRFGDGTASGQIVSAIQQFLQSQVR